MQIVNFMCGLCICFQCCQKCKFTMYHDAFCCQDMLVCRLKSIQSRPKKMLQIVYCVFYRNDQCLTLPLDNSVGGHFCYLILEKSLLIFLTVSKFDKFQFSFKSTQFNIVKLQNEFYIFAQVLSLLSSLDEQNHHI